MTLPGITEAAEAGDWPRRARAGRAGGGRDREEHGAALGGGRAHRRRGARRRRARSRGCARSATASTAAWPSTSRTSVTGERVAIDADAEYETFSVIKVPIMATVLEQVRAGHAVARSTRADAPRPAAHPLGRALRARPGLQPTVRDLLTLMIIISDNQATDALADLVGRDNVTRLMAGLGLSQHADPLLRPRLGPAVAVRRSIRLGRRVRRPDGHVSVREVHRRRR